MKKFIFVLFLILLFISENLFSQDTNIVKYLPLKVGNVWVYHYSYFTPPPYPPASGSGYKKFQITGTTVINSRVFYQYSTITRIIQGSDNACLRIFNNKPTRIDSVTGKIMGWEYCNSNSQEYMIDSLYSKYRDTSNNCGSPYNRIVCVDTSNRQIFPLNKPSKEFNIQGVEAGATWRYSKDIGLTNYGSGGLGYSCGSTLVGCIIDGVLYGDTTMLVGITPISTEIPNQFSLSQNYPNPFNPTTKIRFSIPEVTGYDLSLRVFDVLGKEVAILVNEQLKPGTYEVDFDGSYLPSTIYYYKLYVMLSGAEAYTETKKMVLLK